MGTSRLFLYNVRTWSAALSASLLLSPVVQQVAASTAYVSILGNGAQSLTFGAVSGTVVDGQGRRVENARITLVPVGLFEPSGASYVTTRSGPKGEFRLKGVVHGHYTVTAGALGLVDIASVHVGSVEASISLRLVPGDRLLSGRVVDSAGRPHEGAEVRVMRGLGENGEVFTGQSGHDGSWKIAVPSGDYLAAAVSRDHASPQMAMPADDDFAMLVARRVGRSEAPPSQVSAWIQNTIIPITGPEPGQGFADLQPLRSAIGDASIVGIGEATHGTREIFQIKHRMLEFLVSEMGFTVIAVEFSLTESFDIDDYVMGGDGDPADLLAGQLIAVWQTEELADLLRWMRAWNRTHERKVRFHGLDMRMGVRPARELLRYFDRVDREALVLPDLREVGNLADPILYRAVLNGPAPQIEILSDHVGIIVERLQTRREAYVKHSNLESWWRAMAQAKALKQSLDWYAARNELGRVRVREQAMADNVTQLLGRYGPDSKTIVWAHNAHILGDGDAAPLMMGGHLRKRFGTEYRAVGSTIHRGAFQTIDPETRRLGDIDIPPAPNGSIEHALAATGLRYGLLNLNGLPRSGPVKDWFYQWQLTQKFDGLYDDRRPQGWSTPRSLIAPGYDALLFVAEGRPARPLPVARAMYQDEVRSRTALSNPGMETADAGEPRDWIWSARERICGYAIAVDRIHYFDGTGSARIQRTSKPAHGACAGQLRQVIDATPYRGHRIRFRAAARIAHPTERLYLALKSGTQSSTHAAIGTDWGNHELILDVPKDAETVEVGFAFAGEDRAWFDSVSLDIVPGER